MTVAFDKWTVFVCRSCGWASVGSYGFDTTRQITTVPDTDCHECGSHDSIVDIEHEVPEPTRLDLIHMRLKSEWVA